MQAAGFTFGMDWIPHCMTVIVPTSGVILGLDEGSNFVTINVLSYFRVYVKFVL